MIAHTSLTHPLYLDWLDLAAAPRFADLPGRLGMTILPGKRVPGISGRHERDLELDATRLVTLGVNVFVLLVEDHELVRCGVPGFVETMNRHGIEVLRCPIVDGWTPREISLAERPLSVRHGPLRTPHPGDMAAFTTTLARIEVRLVTAQTVAVSCRGGLGRTGLLAACLLVNGGLDPSAAIAATRASRHGAIETARQEAFVRAWRPAG
jgi:protein-tyrosine phosphatase